MMEITNFIFFCLKYSEKNSLKGLQSTLKFLTIVFAWLMIYLNLISYISSYFQTVLESMIKKTKIA